MFKRIQRLFAIRRLERTIDYIVFSRARSHAWESKTLLVLVAALQAVRENYDVRFIWDKRDSADLVIDEILTDHAATYRIVNLNCEEWKS